MADAYNPPPTNSPVDDTITDPITKERKNRLSFAWNAWFSSLSILLRNILTIDGAQTISNKTADNTNIITVKDSNFTIQDDTDTSKQFKIQASGISTATTRTMTVPDADFTAVGAATSQTLTNKTLATPLLSSMTTTTSAPVAGGGSALPATPAGYVAISINGSIRQIAYY